MAPFNDDEPIAPTNQDNAGPLLPSFQVGKAKETIIQKKEAPLQETDFKVLLKLTGAGAANDRPGVDIVTVLDVSGSMAGEKIDKLKIAMQFLIRKLSPIDRLSVVTFSNKADRQCRLRQVTPASQPELEKLVKGIVANGNTNITDGLKTALQVLADRKLSEGRVGAIMLMSDGVQNAGGDAAKVPVGSVPVHTFGFGKDYDPTVLNAIANNSIGGTFSLADVENTLASNLSTAFSQCLAGLLTVSVEKLTVKVEPVKIKVNGVDSEPKISKVAAGNYPQTGPDAAGAYTVSLGNLYIKETRSILVTLGLPAVEQRVSSRVLRISHSYSSGGQVVNSPPKTVTVLRTGNSVEPEVDDIKVEEGRLKATQMMRLARTLADDTKLDDAKEKLVEAHSMLDDVEVEEPAQVDVIDMLKSEVQQLKRYMRSPEIYKTQGRPFALASETSHERQRFAARGDAGKLRMFATPRMDAYLEQAIKFEEDPSKPPPSSEEDVKQEVAADPVAPYAAGVGFYLAQAIQALQAIQEMFEASA